MSITGAQIRTARALLGWSTRDLAKKASVTVPVILRIEKSNETVKPSPHFAAIQRALEQGSVEFIGSVGLRLRTDK